MKKNTLLVICFSFLFSYDSIAQFSWVKQWDHRYGGILADNVVDFEITKDEGFLLAGKSNSDSSGNKITNCAGGFDYWIIKLDQFGILQWENDYQANGNDVLWALAATSDGGFIIGGSSDSPIGGDKTQASRGGYDYWVIRLDSLGNILWDQTYGGSADDYLSDIIQTTDGGFLIGGDSKSAISGDKTETVFGFNDYWVVKVNSLGVKQWDKVYGGTAVEQYIGSVQTADNGFIHAGHSLSDLGGNKTDSSQGAYDYWFVKTDSIGNIQWDYAYGGAGYDYLMSISKTSDGGIICGGWSNSGISGDKTQNLIGQYDLWVLKLNSNGTIQWDKDLGGTAIEDEINTFYQLNDGGYILGATSYSNAGGDKTENNFGVEQPWIIKIDSIGNKVWDKTVFTMGHNEIGLAKVTGEQKCFVIVTSDGSPAGGDKSESAWGGMAADYWIVKFCEGLSTEVNDLLLGDEELVVYPNPFSDHFKIQLVINEVPSISTATLYDILGKTILSKRFNGTTSFNTSDLSDGIYFLEVISNGKNGRRKIVK